MSIKNDQSGFSLIETVVAMGILATGLLGLAGVFTLGLAHMATSSANLVAREKAREAVESVHTARDTGTVTWAQINNVANGGVFLDGPQSLYNAGNDGLVNTGDDDDNGTAGLEVQRLPGPDGILGGSSTDDVLVPMTNYKRTILISPLNRDDGVTGVNDSLRLITVTITYSVGPVQRTYSLTTYVSSVS